MNDATHIEDLAGRIRPASASNLLLWVVGIFFVAFFAWASLTKLDRTVKGQGRVIASSHLQIISNLEGGVVEGILVKTGQVVKRGQELIRLDPTQSGAELGSGEASVSALSAKVARLEAEVAGREPRYPPGTDPQVANQIQIERSLHSARIQELASVSQAGEARVLQASRAVEEAESALEAKRESRDAKQNELRIIRPLVDKGIEPRLSLVQAESDYAIASSEAAAASSALSRAHAAVGEAQAQLNRER